MLRRVENTVDGKTTERKVSQNAAGTTTQSWNKPVPSIDSGNAAALGPAIKRNDSFLEEIMDLPDIDNFDVGDDDDLSLFCGIEEQVKCTGSMGLTAAVSQNM